MAGNDRRRKAPVLDLEAIGKLRREVEKIPPQKNQRTATNLARLKAAIGLLEQKARKRQL